MRACLSAVGIALLATTLVGCKPKVQERVRTAAVAEDGETVAYLLEQTQGRGLIISEVVWTKTTLYVGDEPLLSDPALDRVGQLTVHAGAEMVALGDGRLVSFDGTVRQLQVPGPFFQSSVTVIAPDGDHVAYATTGRTNSVAVCDMDTAALVGSGSFVAPAGLVGLGVHFRDLWFWTPGSEAFVLMRDFKGDRSTESFIVAVGDLPAEPFPTCAGPMSTTDGTCTKDGVRARAYGYCHDFSGISRVSVPPDEVPDCAPWLDVVGYPFPR